MFIKFMFDLCTREAVPKPTEINGIYRDAEENPLGTGIYLMTALSSPKLRLGSVSLEDSRVLLSHVLPAATGAVENRYLTMDMLPYHISAARILSS